MATVAHAQLGSLDSTVKLTSMNVYRGLALMEGRVWILSMATAVCVVPNSQ